MTNSSHIISHFLHKLSSLCKTCIACVACIKPRSHCVQHRRSSYIDIWRRCNRAPWFLRHCSHTVCRRTQTACCVKLPSVSIWPRVCVYVQRRMQCERGLRLETVLYTTANFTVHTPLNLLSFHLLTADMPCAACVCLERQTTGERGGRTLLLTSACTCIQPMSERVV